MFNRIINQFLSICIMTFRPLLGPATCRYYLTCTPFSLLTLKQKPFLKAVPLIIKRLTSCHSFTK